MGRHITDWIRHVFGTHSPSRRRNLFEERLCAVECGHEYIPDTGIITYYSRSDELEIYLVCSRCGHRKTIRGKWDDFGIIGVEKKHDNRAEENGDS